MILYIFEILNFMDGICMCRGSPNIEMDEHTFMVNRERAVDYLNSLDKVITTTTTIFFELAFTFYGSIIL